MDRVKRDCLALFLLLFWPCGGAGAIGHELGNRNGRLTTIAGIGLDDSESTLSGLAGFKKYSTPEDEGLTNLALSCVVQFEGPQVSYVTGKEALVNNQAVFVGMTEVKCKALIGRPFEEVWFHSHAPGSERFKDLAYSVPNGVLIVRVRQRQTWEIDSLTLAKAPIWEARKSYILGSKD